MNPNRTKIFTAGLGLALFLSACSQLDEMHDSTVSMDQKTSQLLEKLDQTDTRTGNLEKTTQKAAATSDDILATTRSTYLQLRQGDSLNIRRQQLEAVNSAGSLERKVFEAGAYFMAFEYQLKNIAGGDTAEYRLKLYEKATTEFFRSVQDFYSEEEVLSPSSSDNAQRNLYALSLALHEVNPNQDALKDEKEFVPTSMLSLIMKSLSYKNQLEKGAVRQDDLPEFAKVVLNNEGPAIYLLRLRYNVLTALILPKIIPDLDTHKGFWAFFKRFMAEIDSYYSKWTPALTNLNDVQVATLSRYLKAGLNIRTFLNSIGIDPKLDKSVRKVFRNGQVSTVEKPADQLNPRDHLTNEFASLFREVAFPSD